MNVMMSIRKPYTDLIFDGTKPMEFRRKIGKGIIPGSKVYIYECKARSGAGLVVGEVEVKDILQIPRVKVGTYFMLPYYVKKYGDHEAVKTVSLAMQIDLPSYDRSLVLNYLYQDDALSYMKENKKPPKPWPPFHSDLKKYNEAHKKADKLCSDCDEWSTKIGFYNKYGESDWEHMILLENPIRYNMALKVDKFMLQNGKVLKRPPQSWCYVS